MPAAVSNLLLEGDRSDNDVLMKFTSEEWARIEKRVPLPKLLAAVHRLLERGTTRKRCKSVGLQGKRGDLNVA